MQHLRSLAVTLGTAAAFGCADAKVDVPSVGFYDPTVRFHQSLDEVLALRPQVEFAPYAGWIEAGDARGLSEIRYEFSPAWPKFIARRFGHLVAVHLRTDTLTPVLEQLERVRQLYGTPVFVRCETLTPEDSLREIAVLRWTQPEGSGSISARLMLLRRSDRQVIPDGPLVFILTAREDFSPDVGQVFDKSDCFSSNWFSSAFSRVR